MLLARSSALTYVIGLTLVALITYFQQALSLRLNGPRLGSVTPSGLGVLIVMAGGCFLMMKLAGQRLGVARKHLVILYIMLAVGLPLGALGGASALTGSIGRYVFGAGDAGREGNFWYYPIYKSTPLELWPGHHGSPEVTEFNRGGADGVPWEKWKQPLVLWNILFAGVILCMVGLGIVLRRRWLEKEFLPCPLNEFPHWFLQSQNDAPPGKDGTRAPAWMGLRSRALWIGFAIPFVIFMNNGLAHYAPHLFETIPLSSDFGRLFTEEPLSAMKKPGGGPIPFPAPPLQLTIIPALVAVAFFLPKEIPLSIVVFYILGRVLTVLASAVKVKWGIPLSSNSGQLAYFHGDVLPCLYSMGIGAFLFIALSRSLQMLIACLKDREFVTLDFWSGIIFLGGGGGVVAWWLVWFGLPLYLAIMAVVGTVVLAVAFTRLRVEGGIPLLFGVPPLAALFVTLSLTPFTHVYEVTPGKEQEVTHAVSREALKKFLEWQRNNASSSAQSAETVNPATALPEQIDIPASQYCAFLNDGYHDKFWIETEQRNLIYRRPEAFRNAAGLGVLVLFGYIAVLALPALLLEGFHLGDQVHLGRGHVVLAAVLAVTVASAVGQRASLPEYYEVGVETLSSGPASSVSFLTRTWEYQFNDGMNGDGGFAREHVDWVRVVAWAIGFTVASVLTLVRTMFYNFPLTAMGLAVAFLYGAWCWGSMLLGYAAKMLVLRFGGSSLYARAKPFFIGLFCGHVAAMVVWAVVAHLSGEFLNGFNVHIEPALGKGAVF